MPQDACKPDTCKCAIDGCPKSARWQIGFRLWPHGMRNRTAHNAVDGMTGCLVCDEHAVHDPDKFFTTRCKEQIAMQFLQAGKGMPDFSTAQIVHLAIVDDDPISPSEAVALGGIPDEAHA